MQKLVNGQLIDMTEAEIAAHQEWCETEKPQPVPEEISDRQFFQQLAALELITEQEALDAVKTGTLPAALDVFVDVLPQADRFAARMLLSGATQFLRSHPLSEAFGGLQGMTTDEIDQFWRDAKKL